MTGTRRESNSSKQCPSSSQLDALGQSNNNSIRSSHLSQQQHQYQQNDTPRAKRFSQKLVDAAKKQPLARTPSTSASLSPPLESFTTDENDDLDDDYSMADIDSACFASPNRDDQLMNNHFQNLLLSSPLRPELTMTRPVQLDNNHSSTIPDDPSQHHDGLNRPGQLDKRPVKHQHASDSSSLSTKPKRRKLKQQRAGLWRKDSSASLDTNAIHLPAEPNPHRSVSPTPSSAPPVPVQQQGNTRRSSRLANRKVSYGESTNHKKPLVVLGIPAGLKADTEPVATLDDDGDHCGRSVSSSNSSSNEHQKPSRRMRRRVDTVEQRLNQLIFARDTLDLSQHSVLPTAGDKAPITQENNHTVVVIDDSEDESDSHANNHQTHITKTTLEKIDTEHDAFSRKTTTNDDGHLNNIGPHHPDDTLCNKVKLKPVDQIVDLSSTPPSPTLSQNNAPVSTAVIIDEDTEMVNIDEKVTQPPSTDTKHTQDGQGDGDFLMADAERETSPIVDDMHQDIQPPASSSPSPSSSKSKDDPLLSDTTNTLPTHESSLPITGNTIRAPSLSPSPTSSAQSEHDHPVPVPNNRSENCSATNQDTATSTNDGNHKQLQAAAASASTSAFASSPKSLSSPTASSLLHREASPPPAPKVDLIAANAHPSITGQGHPPSQQAKDMYAALTNDENSAPASGDQISAKATSTQAATEMGNSSIGSSEATTLFGRLIGSASHFFLGN